MKAVCHRCTQVARLLPHESQHRFGWSRPFTTSRCYQAQLVHQGQESYLYRQFGTSGLVANKLKTKAPQHGRKIPRNQSKTNAKQESECVSFQDVLMQFESEIRKPDHEIDLMHAASLIALHADKFVDLEKEIHQPLSVLCREFANRIDSIAAVAGSVPMMPRSGRLHLVAETLCGFMAEKGFKGCGRSKDNYYRVENSLVNKVLKTGVGIPITLSLMYIKVGQAGGLELKGINFPGHFLLGFGGGDDIGIIDAFSNKLIYPEHGATTSGRIEGALPPLENRVLLLRMLRNLHGIYMQAGDTHHVGKIAGYMTCLESLLKSSAKRSR